MAAYFDPIAKESIVIIDEQRLTIPDYMTLADIQFFINSVLTRSAQRLLNATYNTQQESPLEKARKHYKDLGWFNDNKTSQSD